MSYFLSDPITSLPGIGPARAKKLEKLGLVSVLDLIRLVPRSYEDRRTTVSILNAAPGTPVGITAVIATQPRLSHIRAGLDIIKVRAVDESAVLDLTFFNQSYLKDSLKVGEAYTFYGVPEGTPSHRTMTNPLFEPEGANRITGRIVPVYSLTAGISNYTLFSAVQTALRRCLPLISDPIPADLRRKYGLMHSKDAYSALHCPPDFETLDAARRRLVFEELLLLSIGLCRLKGRREHQAGTPCPQGRVDEFEALLPFSFTGAQRRAAEDCAGDMRAGAPMNRLVQGDVGSGKTAVAAAAVYLAAKNGGQAALMAPTEILAEQHFRTLSELLNPAGIRVALLTGSTRAKEKRDILERLQLGMIDLLIGTHALISDGVTFSSLTLVITDEQHRFGVNQRAALTGKGQHPHVLVMSATPIPRTLALMVYGDLDVSVIDELPPGRQTVETYRVHTDKRTRMYGFIRKQVEEGHQVYIVCPAVEEGEESEAASSALPLSNVTDYCKKIRTAVFPDLKVDLVHGKMKPAEKERVMSAFSAGEVDILVSTTVIEVGVDVPNATLIVVENAERFGLSQLHQLRGRVGRGQAKSYCVLVSDADNEDTARRLRVLCSTNDGFRISEEDLKLRGPGDFFGSRQHGLPPLKMADLAGDTRILTEAQNAARGLLTEDPALTAADHLALRERVLELFERNPDIFN